MFSLLWLSSTWTSLVRPWLQRSVCCSVKWEGSAKKEEHYNSTSGCSLLDIFLKLTLAKLVTCSYHGRNTVLEVNTNLIGDRQDLHHLHQRRWVLVLVVLVVPLEDRTSPHLAGYLLPGQPGGQFIRNHRRRRRKILAPRRLHHCRRHPNIN